MAVFHLVPSSSATLPFYAINSTHFFGDDGRRNVLGYQGDKLPLPYPALGRSVQEQSGVVHPWESRIPGTPITSLARRIYPGYVDNGGPDPIFDEEDGIGGEDEREDALGDNESDVWKEMRDASRALERTVLIKRSMVTLTDNSPIYSLTKFRIKMRALRNRMVRLSAIRPPRPSSVVIICRSAVQG